MPTTEERLAALETLVAGLSNQYESLYPVTQLAADTDLDTVTTPGVYYATSADISTILNKPPNFAGYLVLVVRRGIYTTMLHQEIYNWSSATTFSKFWRSKTSSADSWTEWIEEFTPVVDYHATSLDPDIDTITDDLIMVASSHSKSCPVSGSWILIQQFFFQSVSVTSRRIQIAYGFPSASSTTNASGMAIRRYSESDNTWSDWEKIYTSRQKPTAEEIGALPVSGGTLTGPLVLPGNPTASLQAAPKQYVDSRVSQVTAAQVGAYTKEETISADTKTLFDLPASTTPDDAFRKLATAVAETPSSYYTSKYSGEEIDALLDWVAAQQEEST